jgi:hypothetical protein
VPPPGFQPKPDVAARRATVLQLRIEQVPYADIGARLGIPVSTAKSDYRRATAQLRTDQNAAASSLRAVERAKLDALEREAWRVLRTRHITVQHGKIVGRYTGSFLRDEDGEIIRDSNDKPVLEVQEIEDDAPVLQAIDRLTRIAQRRAALDGLDAPVKVEVNDARRAEIEQLAAWLAAAGMGDVESEGAGAAPPGAPAGESSPDTA